MKEIGGYLGLDDFLSFPYYDDLIKLNTARNALIYLCRAKKIKKVYLPYYLCDSVSNALKKEGITFEFYHINEEFRPIFDNVLEKDSYLYIVNYFGQLQEDEVLYYQKKYKRIIIDNVQAFFSRPIPGIDTIYSCRKYFGVPDGAYLSTDSVLIEKLQRDRSKDRLKHLFGRYEDDNASKYFADFQNNDAFFVHLPLRTMSKITENFLGCIDYKRVKQIREDNWEILEKAFGKENRLKLTKPDGPYMYPLYCENGIELKRKLIEKKIFIPTLWPNVLNTNDEMVKVFVNNILPIPIDQRYDANTMNEITDMINVHFEIEG